VSHRLEILPEAAWADRVAAELIARLRARPGLRLCLPTGDTPGPVYAALAAAARAGEVSLGAATIVLLDEYLDLAPDSPARADGRLRRELIDHLRPPPEAFVSIDVDGPDPEVAAARHDAAAAEGLDLCLLGLGMNGHVGLNEPGSSPDAPTRVVRVARSSRQVAVERYGADRPPTAGITLGLGRLLESHEIWLLVTGERKAGILARAIAGPEGPDCPASYLRRHHRLVVFADEAAAANLADVGAGAPVGR
jgi:glucosamine-6-phosphate deaminase